MDIFLSKAVYSARIATTDLILSGPCHHPKTLVWPQIELLKETSLQSGPYKGAHRKHTECTTNLFDLHFIKIKELQCKM